MKQRVVLVHGWEGSPDGGWFLWLSDELRTREIDVIAPALPDADMPRIDKWIPALARAVGKPDPHTYFVGHSMGCQAIARYLASLPEGTQTGGAIFVAGFFKRLTGIEDEAEVEEVVREWLTTPLDLAKVRRHLRKSVAIFSDNDPYVPLDNTEDFARQLGSTIAIEHAMGHFTQMKDGVKVLPAALRSLVRIME